MERIIIGIFHFHSNLTSILLHFLFIIIHYTSTHTNNGYKRTKKWDWYHLIIIYSRHHRRRLRWVEFELSLSVFTWHCHKRKWLFNSILVINHMKDLWIMSSLRIFSFFFHPSLHSCVTLKIFLNFPMSTDCLLIKIT